MLSLRFNSCFSRPDHSTLRKTPPKSSCGNYVVPMTTLDADLENDVISTLDQIWEDLIEICLSLEDVRKSPLAKEPARLTDLKMQVKDLEDVIFRFKKASIRPISPKSQHKFLIWVQMHHPNDPFSKYTVESSEGFKVFVLSNSARKKHIPSKLHIWRTRISRKYPKRKKKGMQEATDGDFN